MSKIKDGGPAFPSVLYSHERAENWSTDGMTLRDWFAGQALSAIEVDDWNDADRIAAWAYRIADAMLKAREVTP